MASVASVIFEYHLGGYEDTALKQRPRYELCQGVGREFS